MEPELETTYPKSRFVLLDAWRDPGSRPLLIWIVVLLATGTIIYSALEGWSLLDSLYFCVITLTTIGYGDLTPTTPFARLFTIFYIANGLGLLLALFDLLAKMRLQRTSERHDSMAGNSENQKEEGT